MDILAAIGADKYSFKEVLCAKEGIKEDISMASWVFGYLTVDLSA